MRGESNGGRHRWEVRSRRQADCVSAVSGGGAASLPRMRFTFRRLTCGSRAMARWLRPALRHARTVYSSEATTAGRSSWRTGGAELSGVPSSDVEVARWCVLMRSISSLKLPTRARADHTLTSAPIGRCSGRRPGSRRSWPRCRRLGSTWPRVVQGGPGGSRLAPPSARARSSRLL